MNEPNEGYPSPFDSFPSGPLPACVAHEGHLRGYDVGGDLARHYGFTETVFMLLSGDLPDAQQASVFEIALYLLTDTSIADAAVHAARVTRHVHARSASPPAVAGTAGLALAEQARHIVEEHAEWLRWLSADRTTPPPEIARDVAEKSAGATRFVDALPDDDPVATLIERWNLTTAAAAIALLHGLGLRRDDQLATCIVFARFPVAMAEAFAVEDARLWKYPLNLPYWVYRPEEER